MIVTRRVVVHHSFYRSVTVTHTERVAVRPEPRCLGAGQSNRRGDPTRPGSRISRV